MASREPTGLRPRGIDKRLEYGIMRRVVISGPPPVQILDVTGPLEVFSNIADYEVLIVASDGSDPLLTRRTVAVQPHAFA